MADIDWNALTLEAMAVALAPAVADSAIFDGWTARAVEAAAGMEGLDPAVAMLAYPGGAMDMIAAWIAAIDMQMEQAFTPEVLAAMSVGARIRSMITFRLESIASRREALNRALAVMAMPQNLARSARIGWNSADRMWRLAGDTATDFNHYSKRATLASVYAATLAVFAQDDSDGQADSYAFLDRRLADVTRIGKAKAQWLGKDRDRFSVVRMLGRLRYPAR